jgi:hypothetical protein
MFGLGYNHCANGDCPAAAACVGWVRSGTGGMNVVMLIIDDTRWDSIGAAGTLLSARRVLTLRQPRASGLRKLKGRSFLCGCRLV